MEEETYSRSMQGAEGIDSTWMVEDVDGHYGASPGVLNLEGNLAYVNATAFGTIHPVSFLRAERKSRSRETALSKTDVVLLRLLHAP